MSLVVNLIGHRSQDVIGRLSVSRDVIGCEDCKKWLVRFDPYFVSQKSVGLSVIGLNSQQSKTNEARSKKTVMN